MYMFMASPICRVLDRQAVWRAFSRAWEKTGNRIAARIAIMAMTTSSSIRVKAWGFVSVLRFTRAPFLRLLDYCGMGPRAAGPAAREPPPREPRYYIRFLQRKAAL